VTDHWDFGVLLGNTLMTVAAVGAFVSLAMVVIKSAGSLF
jgi:hypothetical protein